MSTKKEAKIITEGKATIEKTGNDVFYNPAQVTNRDISVAVLKHFVKTRQEEIESGKLKPNRHRRQPKTAPSLDPFLRNSSEIQGIKIFEGLAASGLRSLRYAMEAIVACDLDSTAVESMHKNVASNGLGSEKVHPIHADARLHMLQHPSFYDVIDLDPYGTPVAFLDSAVQSISEGGLLCVTATDMAVLCGSNPEACYTKYGSISLKRGYCHEMAIRILLQCIQAHANRYKKHILPVLSISVDFYIRVFVRLFLSAEQARYSPSKLAWIHQSTACDSFYFQPVCSVKSSGRNPKFHPAITQIPQCCPETGSKIIIGGPIWINPMHDASWVRSILTSIKAHQSEYSMQSKLIGVLTTISEELLDAPLYVNLHLMCQTVNAVVPKMDYFTSAIVEAGFKVSGTHCAPVAFKTNAPFELLWDMIRAWIKEQPISKVHDPNTAIGRLLNKEMKYNVKFSNRPMSSSRKAGVTRFVQNPDHWGPLTRHGRKIKQNAEEPIPTKHKLDTEEETSDTKKKHKSEQSKD
eukprot:g3121.t1